MLSSHDDQKDQQDHALQELAALLPLAGKE